MYSYNYIKFYKKGGENMPIQAQCCGLFLMLILLYFYKTQRRIKLQGEVAYWNTVNAILVSIICDIVSCFAIVYSEYLPDLLVKFICKTYVATMVAETFFALLYIFSDIYLNKNVYRKAMMRYGILTAAELILIYAAPIYYTYDSEAQTLYSHGACCYTAYMFAAVTVIIIFVRLHKDRARINPSKRSAVYMWMAIWGAALLVQFFFKQILLTAFAGALGMLVLYLKLENPGNNLDRQTGLFNHSAFLQYAKQLYESDIEFSVLAIIIDRGSFKSMRSDLEERVIAEAVMYLSSLSGVYVFRNTTNEIFLVYTDKHLAMQGVAAVRERFESGWGTDGGVIVTPHWIYVPDTNIVDNVDDLLYLIQYVRRDSKDFINNQYYEITDTLASSLRYDKEISELIVSALANDRVEVWFQPIFSTEEHRFTSAEALVRIRDEDGKLIPPGAFIDIAERNGMILQLGELVFRKVCRFLSETDIIDHGINYIEVNLSVVQCAHKHLADEYMTIMKEYNVSPGYINLEITESASMSAKKTLLKNMTTLIEYGVSFSLDDFGTGQSNLDYILDMPVNIVKFDKNMTNAYFENGKAKYIMDAAMNMIRGMDLKIVSEGIENAEQFMVMESLGINYIQGYHFSKPLPEAEFLEFIKVENAKMMQ